MTAVSEPDTRTVVIVGTGIAGSGAAQALRKEGFGGSIILIGSEPEEPVPPPSAVEGATVRESVDRSGSVAAVDFLDRAEYRSSDRRNCHEYRHRFPHSTFSRR